MVILSSIPSVAYQVYTTMQLSGQIAPADGAASAKPTKKDRKLAEVALPIPTATNVQICTINSPEEFWVQREDDLEKLAQLESQLQVAYAFGRKKRLEQFEPGTSCCAFITANKMWYRAIILPSYAPEPPPSSVRVFLCDGGATHVVEKASLMQIQKDFMKLPANAIKCTLISDRVPGFRYSWTTAELQYFGRFQYKCLRSDFLTRFHNDGAFAVNLFDESVSPSLDIKERLFPTYNKTLLEYLQHGDSHNIEDVERLKIQMTALINKYSATENMIAFLEAENYQLSQKLKAPRTSDSDPSGYAPTQLPENLRGVLQKQNSLRERALETSDEILKRSPHSLDADSTEAQPVMEVLQQMAKPVLVSVQQTAVVAESKPLSFMEQVCKIKKPSFGKRVRDLASRKDKFGGSVRSPEPVPMTQDHKALRKRLSSASPSRALQGDLVRPSSPHPYTPISPSTMDAPMTPPPPPPQPEGNAEAVEELGLVASIQQEEQLELQTAVSAMEPVKFVAARVSISDGCGGLENASNTAPAPASFDQQLVPAEKPVLKQVEPILKPIGSTFKPVEPSSKPVEPIFKPVEPVLETVIVDGAQTAEVQAVTAEVCHAQLKPTKSSKFRIKMPKFFRAGSIDRGEAKDEVQLAVPLPTAERRLSDALSLEQARSLHEIRASSPARNLPPSGVVLSSQTERINRDSGAQESAVTLGSSVPNSTAPKPKCTVERQVSQGAADRAGNNSSLESLAQKSSKLPDFKKSTFSGIFDSFGSGSGKSPKLEEQIRFAESENRSLIERLQFSERERHRLENELVLARIKETQLGASLKASESEAARLRESFSMSQFERDAVADRLSRSEKQKSAIEEKLKQEQAENVKLKKQLEKVATQS